MMQPIESLPLDIQIDILKHHSSHKKIKQLLSEETYLIQELVNKTLSNKYKEIIHFTLQENKTFSEIYDKSSILDLVINNYSKPNFKDKIFLSIKSRQSSENLVAKKRRFNENWPMVWKLIMLGQAQVVFEDLRKKTPVAVPTSKVSSDTTDYTPITEAILLDMLENYEAYEIEFILFEGFIKRGGVYFLDPQTGARLALSKLVKKTDFNQIHFSRADITKAEAVLDVHDYPEKAQHFNFPEAAGLTVLEKTLIIAYTLKQHEIFNRFLQGRFLSLSDKYPCFSYYLKRLFLGSAILVSALNKMPNCKNPFLYRMENDPPSEVIQDRIKAVRDGTITAPYGLISTSADQPVAHMADRKVVIIYVNGMGKDISRLSAMEFEKEVLLTPTPIQWLYHISLKVDGILRHIFFAKQAIPTDSQGRRS